MDWRSSSDPRPPAPGARARLSRRVGSAVLLALLALVALGACGKNAVRASEKEFLADQTMVFDSNGQEAGADEHILSNREGAAGGRGTSGGGCGCN